MMGDMSIGLHTQLSVLPDIGKKTAAACKKIGMYSILDALYYFPFRYEDFSNIIPIEHLVEGELVTVHGQVELIANKRSFKTRKIITECLIKDATATLRVVWFNQPFLTRTLTPGEWVYISGKPVQDIAGYKMVSPVYEKDKKGNPLHTGRLVPIYPLTAGLTQKMIRVVVSSIVGFAAQIPEWLPEDVLKNNDLGVLSDAVRGVHMPHNEQELKQSTDRLKFDELLLVQLQAELARLQATVEQAPEITFQEQSIKEFVTSLGFTLTKTQKIAAWEILQDSARAKPMNRLLSGDVGSGKTVVAAIALYNTVLSNLQGVLMVPTEILARQHFESLGKLLGKYGIRIGLFTRSQRMVLKKEVAFSKKEILEAIKEHEVDIIIGTQSFLSENVEFKKLGLVIVDEQHRFGVEQRRIIKEKGRGVHFLSMTATPIPRSLALMIYGDLDVSIINELPPGRKPIATRLVEPHNRSKAYEFIHEQVKKGRQVFVICPLIDDGDILSDKKSVLQEYKKLSENIFPNLRVGYLHGKLKPAEKEAVMNKFSVHELDILVSTSVVEVGVNIPNASVMMIEGAERFGLAQLHQFRGRVGRAEHQSYCLLFTDSGSKKATERLVYFESCRDGFKLAEKDLEIRGPGEVYGTEQSGMMQLRLAKLTDQALIKKARDTARTLASHIKNYPLVLARVKKWKEVVHLE